MVIHHYPPPIPALSYCPIHGFESHSLISFLIECFSQTKEGNTTLPLLRLADGRLVLWKKTMVSGHRILGHGMMEARTTRDQTRGAGLAHQVVTQGRAARIQR